MKYELSKNPVVNEYIDSLETPLKDLFIQIRCAVLEAASELEENIKWKNCLTYGVRRNAIQTVVGKQHISLIFFEGMKLADPSNILEGNGTKTKTAKITKDNFKPEALAKLAKDAAKLAK